MANRLEHFQFSDPLSKEAVCRSTRYRHLRKRKKDGQHIISYIEELPEGREEDEDEPQLDVLPSHSGSICPCCSEIPESEDLAELLPQELYTSDIPFTESDSSGDDSESETSDTVAKVFNGCPLTPSASNLLILQYSARHNLTQEAVSDLLKLLSIHLPTPNTIPKSLYCFQKKFPSLQYNLKLHYYCSSCLQQVDKKDVVICPNAQCRQSLQNYRALSTFFELPIETQIASLMGRKYIYSDILYYVRS